MPHTKPTTQYTITAAHRITGKSRTTLQKHIKRGKLSCVEGTDGTKRIDASELIRVYGDDCDFKREEGPDSLVPQQGTNLSTGEQSRLNSVQQQLNTLTEERRREREQLQSQIDQLQNALQLAQEGHNRATLLLESNTKGGGDWQEAFATIEQRITNQATQSQQELEEFKTAAKRQIVQHKRALEAEIEKPFWQRLLG